MTSLAENGVSGRLIASILPIYLSPCEFYYKTVVNYEVILVYNIKCNRVIK